jgi:hypothetical protein
MTTATIYRRVLASICALIAIPAVFEGRPASAAANPAWQLGASGPDRVEPGKTFFYKFTAENVGDADSDGTGSLDVTLPPGIAVVSVTNQFGIAPAFNWACADSAGGSTLHCDLTVPVPAGQTTLEQVILTAKPDPAASGDVVTHYSLTGGGASPSALKRVFSVSSTPDFGISTLDGEVSDGQGNPFTQAGGHPVDASVTFSLNRLSPGPGLEGPDGSDLKQVEVDIPPGMIGNPTATQVCSKDLRIPQNQNVVTDPNVDINEFCPVSSIVGEAIPTLVSPSSGIIARPRLPIFSVEPPPGVAAQFAFTVWKETFYLDAVLRHDGEYSLAIRTRNINQGLAVLASTVTLWGVPSDHSHDDVRCLVIDRTAEEFGPLTDCNDNAEAVDLSVYPLLGPNPAYLSPKAFLTNPTTCTPPGEGLTTTLHVAGWNEPSPSDSASFVSHNPPGYPLPMDQWGSPQGPTGCEDVPFTPSVSAEATSRAADSPTGLDVSIDVPTDGLVNPTGIAQSHLKKAVVTLPEGMAVNPSSADGLGACSEAEIGLGSDRPVGCPDSSKVGTVSVETPLLEEALEGHVYLAEQGNRPGRGSNPFGSLLALYIVVESEERGVLIKLPGRVDADPQTGRLQATFDNNPQLPFSSLRVRVKSGPRAPLTLPSECGTYEVVSELYPWARPDEPVTVRSPFTVDQGCGPRGFAPEWSAGSVSPIAGAFSPFVASFSREDGEQRFDGVSVQMPKGVLAKLAGVPLCGDVQAANGACPVGSRVGSATTGAGAGPNPFFLEDQPVYLTGPYKGAPYGLAVVVRAVAGPFDLGTVVVRQAIHVDRSTAQVRIVSDPLPRILDGIPLNIRDVRVNVDRPRFTLNPTSCAEKEVGATLTSTQGTVHRASSRFQVGDCSALAFKPRLSLRLTGRKQTRTGRHPGVRAQVRQTGIGEAGIRKAKVALPKSLALDPDNAQALCEFEDGTKPDLENRCPKGSIVGRARAVTPLLDKPLAGNVYFVKNIRRTRSGNLIRTLPMIIVALRGQIAINLKGTSSTTQTGQLVNTFANVPDAPISRFQLNIRGGSNGILTVTRTQAARINLCANPRGHRAQVDMRGHNGKQANFATRVKTPCAKAAKAKRRR